mgnify:CR=1 FL=1
MVYKITDEIAKSGDKIVKVNDFYLHSKYNPFREAEKFADVHFKKNHLHILFGCGAGYFVKSLCNRLSEEEFLIVIEPIEAIADRLLKNFNYLKQVILIKGEDLKKFKEVYKLFENNYMNRIHVICSPNYDKFASTYYEQILKFVKDQIYLQQVEMNTLTMYSKDWQRNITSNLYYAFNDIPFKDLKRFYDLPVVVASGGPSLTKQLPLLKKVRENVVLISSGSTINTLLKNEIEPDFVVSIDGGINNYRHFETVQLKNARIIYSLLHHEKILDKYNRRSIVFIPDVHAGIQKYVCKLLDKNIDLVMGGTSVANFALNIAYLITTGPVAIIGQDLAYTENKTHAESNKNYREIDETFIKQRALFYTEGYHGDEVLTDYPFFTMKQSFEKLIQTFEKPERIYNCTEGGVKLKHFQQISFNEFCQKFVDKDKYPQPMVAVTEQEKNKNDWENFLVRVNHEIATHQKVERLLQDAILLLKQNRLETKFERQILKKLDNIDEKLKQIFAEGFMSLIAQPIVLNTFQNYLPKENELEHETFQRIFARSLDLYTRLKEAASDSRSFFQHLKNKIENKLKSFDIEG